LLVNFRNGVLQPRGRLKPDGGLNQLVLDEEDARQLVKRERSKGVDKWTIPQVAEMLQVKQEVAYFLVRKGMLTTNLEVIGRREAAMVTRDDLDAFRARFVLARDLAKLHKTSSRSLQCHLSDVNIQPVASPLLGACRQVIYEKSPELIALFSALAHSQSLIHCTVGNS
jgi:hypothetical protein